MYALCSFSFCVAEADISPAWFRLFVGDLSNDVSDDVLAGAFNKYPSFQKARVIRDRLSQKVCPVLCHSHTAAHQTLGQVRFRRFL